ncbi:transporter substrate-binding domain-containing protein [Streptomyces sp. NPDC015032]|uniref:transporter substrate-binding domain-containing protein n=1 Tax=Streptomyces sp. NPDC015032 TaxID=3364937 RepID=UPI0036FFC40B
MSPVREHDPLDTPVEALAWALVGLRSERGVSLGQMAPRAHFDKGTLSRVTNGRALPGRVHLEGYVRACSVDSGPWVALLGLAQTAVHHGDSEALQDFAVALRRLCVADLPEYSRTLGSAQSLVTAWTLRKEPGEEVSPEPVVSQGPSGQEEPTVPSNIREVSTPRKLLSPPRRRTVLTGCITCLAVLAAGGIWLIGHHTGTTDARPSVSASPSNSPKEDFSLQRLHDAQAGKVTWKIGVKRSQLGLSEKKKHGWSGVEIEYAKLIAKALKIKKWKFVDQGTNGRAEALENGYVDMFIGTYGISVDRKRGVDGHPPVLFAGPYFQTPERIMLERFPGTKNARIQRRNVPVNAFEDLPPDTRVCVVKGSTADAFLSKEKKFEKRATPSDYDLCINELRGKYDAVMTDSTILQQYEDRHPDAYVIAHDPFGVPEKYGIGLKQDALGLQREVCKAMRDVTKEAEELYKKLAVNGASVPNKLDERPAP